MSRLTNDRDGYIRTTVAVTTKTNIGYNIIKKIKIQKYFVLPNH